MLLANFPRVKRYEQKTFRTSLPQRNASLLLAAWLPAFLGILVICGESTSTMGADHTGVWLARLCSPLPITLNFDLGHLNHLLRKNGHFFGYGTLAFCFARGWMFLLAARLKQTWTRVHLTAGALGILSATAIASMDEMHQSFLSNRGASVADVLLDTSGALLLVAVTSIYVLVRRRRVLAQLIAKRNDRSWFASATGIQTA